MYISNKAVLCSTADLLPANHHARLELLGHRHIQMVFIVFQQGHSTAITEGRPREQCFPQSARCFAYYRQGVLGYQGRRKREIVGIISTPTGLLGPLDLSAV